MKIILKEEARPKFVEVSELKEGDIYVVGNAMGLRTDNSTGYYLWRVVNKLDIPEGKALLLRPKDKLNVYNGEVEIEFAKPKTVDFKTLKHGDWFVDPDDLLHPVRVFLCDKNYVPESDAYEFKDGEKCPFLHSFGQSYPVIPIPEPTIIIGDENGITVQEEKEGK